VTFPNSRSYRAQPRSRGFRPPPRRGDQFDVARRLQPYFRQGAAAARVGKRFVPPQMRLALEVADLAIQGLTTRGDYVVPGAPGPSNNYILFNEVNCSQFTGRRAIIYGAPNKACIPLGFATGTVPENNYSVPVNAPSMASIRFGRVYQGIQDWWYGEKQWIRVANRPGFPSVVRTRQGLQAPFGMPLPGIAQVPMHWPITIAQPPNPFPEARKVGNGDAAVPPARTNTHALVRPGPGVKERKTRVQRALLKVMEAYDFFTEVVDAVDALYDALPEGVKNCKKGDEICKSNAIYRHFGEMDTSRAIFNLLYNQIEDLLWGMWQIKQPGTPYGSSLGVNQLLSDAFGEGFAEVMKKGQEGLYETFEDLRSAANQALANAGIGSR